MSTLPFDWKWGMIGPNGTLLNKNGTFHKRVQSFCSCSTTTWWSCTRAESLTRWTATGRWGRRWNLKLILRSLWATRMWPFPSWFLLADWYFHVVWHCLKRGSGNLLNISEADPTKPGTHKGDIRVDFSLHRTGEIDNYVSIQVNKS